VLLLLSFATESVAWYCLVSIFNSVLFHQVVSCSWATCFDGHVTLLVESVFTSVTACRRLPAECTRQLHWWHSCCVFWRLCCTLWPSRLHIGLFRTVIVHSWISASIKFASTTVTIHTVLVEIQISTLTIVLISRSTGISYAMTTTSKNCIIGCFQVRWHFIGDLLNIRDFCPQSRLVAQGGRRLLSLKPVANCLCHCCSVGS